ncbi:MAG: efflux RND transporter periplasmic adaptor subunit [Candidatus Riflebacteria bacterium]
MKKYFKYLFALILLISLLISKGSSQTDHSGHDHEGHDHSAHAKQEKAVDSHAGHEHSGHNHQSVIELTPAQKSQAAIKVETAGSGNLNHLIGLSGEIALNSDTLIHHVSRAPGIIAELKCTNGDYVRKGDILAAIDSFELGQAKSEFYEIFNEVGCCAIDLQRFRVVSANTGRLLKALEKMPEIDTLAKIDFGDMADYGANLLKTYAEHLISSKTFKRKSKLYSEKIISENEFLISQNNYEKAMAEFFATRDNAKFEIKQKLLDLERLMKVNEFKLRTAERKLQLFGLSHEEINAIRAHGAEIQTTCTVEGCTECAVNSANQSHHTRDTSFSQVQLRAERSGTVVFRDAELGQEVDKNKVLFTIADISNLWSILQVSQKDQALVKTGMEVTISASDGRTTNGRILMVNPVVDEKTRTVAVRVSLNNDTGKWMPGTFVSGQIKIVADNVAVLVKRSAIQIIDGKATVFVPEEHGFILREVKTGREDSEKIEILSGLQAGESYVTDGAFALKSIKVTSTMDSHAGHGH